MKQLTLMVIFLMAYVTQAHAAQYVCTGLDEAPGFKVVVASPDADGILKPFAHVNGAELRLLQTGSSVSLTLKKSQSQILTVVANQGKLLLSQTDTKNSQENFNVSCIQNEE